MSSEEVSTERLTQKPAAAAGGEERRKEVTIVLAGDRLLDEADLPLIAKPAVAVARINNHEAGRIEFEMAFDERQRPRPIEPKPIITRGPSILP